MDLVQGLLVKYPVQQRMSGHHDGDIIIKRQTEHHFSRRRPPTEKKCKPTRQCVACSKELQKKTDCIQLLRQ
jgi:hypothetical protein